jgi:hypothetical protein
MNIKFAILILIASILTMAVYSSSTNFVSAATECFGAGSVDTFFCTSTVTLSSGEEHTFIMECSKDKDGHWNCEKLGARVTPPGIEDSIKKSMMSEGLGKSTTGNLGH